uniref:Uncharacterized protein n=1 Tax=Aeromonas phage vB_AdhaM_G2 TaxID=3238786 RepID=A0AB39TZ97_9CAUD
MNVYIRNYMCGVLWGSIFNEDHCKGKFVKIMRGKHLKPFYQKSRY